MVVTLWQAAAAVAVGLFAGLETGRVTANKGAVWWELGAAACAGAALIMFLQANMEKE